MKIKQKRMVVAPIELLEVGLNKVHITHNRRTSLSFIASVKCGDVTTSVKCKIYGQMRYAKYADDEQMDLWLIDRNTNE